MITFGYRNRAGSIVRALAALAIGIVMVSAPEKAMGLVVQIIAAFFVASGLVSLVYGLMHRREGGLSLLVFNAVVDVAIGALLFSFPGFVASFVIYLVAILLLGFGIMQIVALVGAASVLGFGFAAFIMPVLVTLVGGFMLFNPFAKEVMSIIAGTALIVYGVSELLSAWRMKKAIDEYEIKFGPQQDRRKSPDMDDVRDVDYEKVDDRRG